MRPVDFSFRLAAATFSSLRLAQKMVKDRLTVNVKYVVALNCSYDDNRAADEIVFPADNGRIDVDLDYREWHRRSAVLL